MNAAIEQQVRERAYHMWIASGMNDGCADAHWLSAEQAVRNEAEVVTPMKAKVVKASVAKVSVAKASVAKSDAVKKSAVKVVASSKTDKKAKA